MHVADVYCRSCTLWPCACRYHTWLQRLRLEACKVGFDQMRSEANGYKFTETIDARGKRSVNVSLPGMGPKLLISNKSTRDQRVLVWRFVMRGNNAVEFGAIPDDPALLDSHQALHRCQAAADGANPVGFCSNITVGSQLPLRVPVIKGSVVEVVASRGLLQVMILNPEDGQQLHWHQSRTVPKPYRCAAATVSVFFVFCIDVHILVCGDRIWPRR